MGSTSAYWITPKGEILKPNAYHIGSVMKNPSKFGMTTDELKKIYDRYGEKYSPYLEGNAREEIMNTLLKRGFIRIRERKLGGYIIQLYKITDKNNDFIWEWANNERKVSNDRYADVTIHTLINNKRKKTNLEELVSGKNINEDGVSSKDIIIYTDDTFYMTEDYFDYAERIVDEDTEQCVIDEIYIYNNNLISKYIK
jgi:hypothetical protein